MKVPEKIPDWLAVREGAATLNINELAILFGYKHGGSLNSAIFRGLPGFPKEDFIIKASSHGYGIGRRLWKVSTIRNFIRRHNRTKGV